MSPATTPLLRPASTASRGVFALAVAPVLVLAALFTLFCFKGPYWLGSNADPDYAYLFNGLLIATGHAAWHVDHPGTPVQLLIAGLLRLSHPTLSTPALVRQVLRFPEQSLMLAQVILLVLLGAALYAAGRIMHQVTRSLAAGLFVELFPLTSPTLVRETLSVKPEPVILILGVLIAVLSLREAAAREERAGTSRRALLLGLLTALAVTAKVTALPLVIVPLLLLRANRQRRLFLISLLVCGAAILVPAFPHLNKFFALTGSIATGSGRYGRGGPAANPHGNAYATLLLVAREPAVVLALAGAIAAGLFSRRGVPAPEGTLVFAPRVHVALAVAIALNILLLASNPFETRYLFPALALAGPALAAASLTLWPRLAETREHLLRTAIGVVVAGGAVAALVLTGRQFRGEVVGLATENALLAADFSTIPVIPYYHASDPDFALFFGDQWAGNRYADELDALHPGAIFYNIWAPPGAFVNFAHSVPINALTNHRILLRGASTAVLPGLDRRPEFRLPLLGHKVPDRQPVDALYLAPLPPSVDLPFSDYVVTGLGPLSPLRKEDVLSGNEVMARRTEASGIVTVRFLRGFGQSFVGEVVAARTTDITAALDGKPLTLGVGMGAEASGGSAVLHVAASSKPVRVVIPLPPPTRPSPTTATLTLSCTSNPVAFTSLRLLTSPATVPSRAERATQPRK